jgi:tetratricopeptide (TPR) repeat protein
MRIRNHIRNEADIVNFVIRLCASVFEKLSACVSRQNIAPDAVDDYSLAIDLAGHAVESDPSSAMYAAVLGDILYRAGKYEQSLVHQLQAVDLGNAVPRSEMIGEPAMWFALAMTHHKLGHDVEASQLLTKPIAQTNEILDQESEAYKSLDWRDRFWFERLRDEAIGLIGNSSSKSNDSADYNNGRTVGSVS